MLKILHIIPTLRRGGAERLVLNICNVLLKQGFDVLLVVMYEQNEYPELSENINIRYCSSRVVPSLSGKAKIEIDDFINIVNDFKPDIIHSHLFETEILSRWKLFHGIAYISHCHDNFRQFKKFDLNCLLKKSRLTDIYERKNIINRYIKCRNHFIAISNDSKLFLKNNLPKDLHNFTLMHNAIDIARFEKYRTFVKNNLDPHNVKLINTGSFVDKKNQIFLIDVVKVLHDKGHNVSMELLGDGPNMKKIENKIKEAGFSGSIYCRGNVNNVEDYLHKADIYVHSATYESFGLSLIEAMAAGLPVVCLDGKGNRDILKEGYNGFMVKYPNAELFAEKIINLISNPELYNTISKNAIKFAADYDIGNYINSLAQLYKSVLATTVR
jgi:glycosyltransferase involved in cell wall biosynthesis